MRFLNKHWDFTLNSIKSQVLPAAKQSDTSPKGNRVLRNEIANLAQDVELGLCWFDFVFFHPCLVAGLHGQTNTFFSKPSDGCDRITPEEWRARPVWVQSGTFPVIPEPSPRSAGGSELVGQRWSPDLFHRKRSPRGHPA
jgi:hypothetical protein